MNKKASILGTIAAFIVVSLIAGLFFLFFNDSSKVDIETTFETIDASSNIDDFDFMLMSFLRTKEGDLTMADHLILDDQIARDKVTEVFSSLCEGVQECYWEFKFDNFRVGSCIPDLPLAVNDIYENKKETKVKIPGIYGDKEVVLKQYVGYPYGIRNSPGFLEIIIKLKQAEGITC